MCWVGGESAQPSGGLRCTGDCVSVDSAGCVQCTGRLDRQIKRHGHRVNLDTVEQVYWK